MMNPMRILHTSDWHIGKRLESYSRLDEQNKILQEICDIALQENVHAVIVAGDLFDSYNPSTDAVDLFYKTLKQLTNNGTRPVICIAGNHDSPDRIEAPNPLARECGIIFAGYPNSKVVPFELDTGLRVSQSDEGFIELIIPGQTDLLRIILMPYANESRLKTCLNCEDTNSEMLEIIHNKWQAIADKYCDDQGVNILLHHMFMISRDGQIPEEPEDEKPMLHVGGTQAIYADMIPQQIQYAAAGHLHRPMTICDLPCPVVYSGSPLAYSFSEAGQEKSVIIVDLLPIEKAKYHKIKLNSGKVLCREKFESINEAVLWLTAHSDTLVELTLVSDTYLNALDKARLNNAHPAIITIIPEITVTNVDETKMKTIDLTQNITNLFVEYFKYKTTQQPNDELLSLFSEVLAVEESP